MSSSEIYTPLRQLAFPDIFPEHASRGELLGEVGLDVDGVTASVTRWVDALADRG